jgi:sulfur-oxidizing protein SoxZ
MEVKMLVDHPMESGRRKDGDGNLIPAHYIDNLTATYNGNTVFSATLGPAVSKDPYLKFEVEGAEPGGELTISWTDNMGESATETVNVK